MMYPGVLAVSMWKYVYAVYVLLHQELFGKGTKRRWGNRAI